MRLSADFLMDYAERIGIAPEDVPPRTWNEIFADWAGFKSVDDMMRYELHVDVDSCDAPDGTFYGVDFVHHPYEPNLPFDVNEMYKAIEKQL